jgi:hypothetical protein
MIKFSLESTDTLFTIPDSEDDQMAQDVQLEAGKEYGADQLLFDQKTSIMPELNEISEDAALGFNVYPSMDSYLDSMVDGEDSVTVE